MREKDHSHFHRLFGAKKTRISYQKKDFLDYALMIIISAFVVLAVYGSNNVMSLVGVSLCAFMFVTFLIRHGVEFRVPVILKSPRDIIYTVIYKILNIKFMYIVAVTVLLLENFLIYFTPDLPHNTELMRKISFYLFYLHFIVITFYRTVILIAHLKKKDHVAEVLGQTAWKRFITKRSGVSMNILHAYFTGILTHMILIAPWYVVITYFNFSIIFLPVICAINIIISMNFIKVINAWFYRDHWLGHNSEFEFIYLHGSHHDAIPSGLIGVAGNGFLEGFLRHVLAFPNPFFNPVIASLVYTFEIKQDIDTHQFIPGIFPKSSREFQEVNQHSVHHFGRLQPYGFGMKLDQTNTSEEFKSAFKRLPDELVNSAKLDEILTDFEWDNAGHRRYLDLFDRYQNK